MAEHTIKEYSAVGQVILCKCGAEIRPRALPLDQTWNLHRGKTARPPAISDYDGMELATDAEVGEFLAKLGNPWHPFQVSLSQDLHTPENPAHDLSHAWELLERLKEGDVDEDLE